MVTVDEVLDHSSPTELSIEAENQSRISQYGLCRVVIPHLYLISYPALLWSLSTLHVIELNELESWLNELIELGRDW